MQDDQNQPTHQDTSHGEQPPSVAPVNSYNQQLHTEEKHHFRDILKHPFALFVRVLSGLFALAGIVWLVAAVLNGQSIWLFILWPIPFGIGIAAWAAISRNRIAHWLSIIAMIGISYAFFLGWSADDRALKNTNQKKAEEFDAKIAAIDYSIYIPGNAEPYLDKHTGDIFDVRESADLSRIVKLGYQLPPRGFVVNNNLVEYPKEMFPDDNCAVSLTARSIPPCEKIVTTPKGTTVYGHNLSADPARNESLYYFDIGETRIAFSSPAYNDSYTVINQDNNTIRTIPQKPSPKFVEFVDSFKQVDISAFKPVPITREE